MLVAGEAATPSGELDGAEATDHERDRERTTGGDRPQLCRYALGSLREVNRILLAAVAFGWFAEAPLPAERDRLGAILFGLQRR